MEFRQAQALHRQGRLADASRSYEEVIRQMPNHFEALHLLGVLAYQSRQPEQAVRLIAKAISINPNVASFYSNQGLALQQLGRFGEALAGFDKAIALKPDHVLAYYLRGNVLCALERFDDAIGSYDAAIALKPDYAEAHSNRGIALYELGRFEEALVGYGNAIAAAPDFTEAHANKGNALYALARFDEALSSYDKAVAFTPDYALAFYNRGNALYALKRLGEARTSYDKAIALRPDYAAAFYNRGNALYDLQRIEEALISYDQAIVLKPDYPEAYSNRGNALKAVGRLGEAIESYDAAIAIKADYAEAHKNRGDVLMELDRIEDAIASFEKAIAIDPDLPFLSGRRLHAKMHLCDWNEIDTQIQDLETRIENGEKAADPFTVLGLIDSPSLQRKAAEIYVRAQHPIDRTSAPAARIPVREKIRVCYFSANYHDHAVPYLMAEFFELQNKKEFELFAFSFGPSRDDGMRRRLQRAFDEFMDVRGQSDEEIARLSRDRQIDIAVDLMGFTQDYRLGIFSHRAAPLQVGYLGYPGATGADYIDYIVADQTLIPVESQKHYSEKIIYLPNSYQVSDRKRIVSGRILTHAEMGLPENGFVFCCFNYNYKITPETFGSWMRILRAVEGSVLWLRRNSNVAAANLRKEAERCGVGAERLIFADRMPLAEDHLARHRLADLFLDTLPYNAHTTTSDALWAGLPVITLMGQSLVGRVAASLLNAVDLPELVTHSREEYEQLAIELATHPAELAGIKEKLARNRLTTPLFDTPLFTRHMETAYTRIVERHRAGLLPDNIYIEA